MNCIEATLPYPPSVNKYWITRLSKRVNPKTGKKKKIVTRTVRVKKYIRDVGFILFRQRNLKTAKQFLRLELSVYPPDNKKRDLDNICKAVLDALQSSGVCNDDFDIWQLYVERCKVVRGGEVKMKLFSLENVLRET